jgi:hypothetical protein
MFRELADQIEAGTVDAFVCYADTPKGLLVMGNNCQGIGATFDASVKSRTWWGRISLAFTMLRHGRWALYTRLADPITEPTVTKGPE